MVRKVLFVILVFYVCFLSSCDIDLFGIFGSTDLDDRLKERNNFQFLSAGDMSLTLGGSYSFIVISDLHILNGDTRGLEKLKDITDNDSEIKFLVFNGDITQCGYRQDLREFIKIAGTLDVPCYPVIGNHDIFQNNWSVWKELIGSTCYRINGDTATLLIMDSANAYFGNDQLNWLERELRNTGGRVFVFSHVNLFVSSPIDRYHFTDTRERARVLSILKGRCDAMFMGHLHHQQVNEAGGVKYITVENYRDNRTYCRVDVTATGISWEIKKL